MEVPELIQGVHRRGGHAATLNEEVEIIDEVTRRLLEYSPSAPSTRMPGAGQKKLPDGTFGPPEVGEIAWRQPSSLGEVGANVFF